MATEDDITVYKAMVAKEDTVKYFLFVILQQKCLKDVNYLYLSQIAYLIHPFKIDWNKVAHDLIFPEQITNSYTARIRYNYLKAAMFDLKPSYCNRYVLKAKKDTKLV